jgi:hypothetical protein
VSTEFWNKCIECDGLGLAPCDNCDEVDDHVCHLDGEEYGPYPCDACGGRGMVPA